jgi:cell division protein FtsI (penicillin-binding protein 3)
MFDDYHPFFAQQSPNWPSQALQQGDRFFTLRVWMVLAGFVLAYLFLMLRLGTVPLQLDDEFNDPHAYAEKTYIPQRANITDRNGTIIATNLSTTSIYANPKQLLDKAKAAEKLASIFPDLRKEKLLEEFKSNKHFVWIKRNVTPKELYAINHLGLPGINFERSQQRVYPHGSLFSHILGYTGVDGKGLSGIEQSFQNQLTAHLKNTTASAKPSAKPSDIAPLALSIDVRIQTMVREELQAGINHFQAAGGTSIVMDSQTGEIISMVNLPDFDSNHPTASTEKSRFNQASFGSYEVGSIIKILTLAIGLDAGAISMSDQFDVTDPIRIARYRIKDLKPAIGLQTVSDLFLKSSNIGMAKIGLNTGAATQQKYFSALGMFKPTQLEIPERASPMYPSVAKWNDVSTMTIAYGYGASFTPVHMVQAMGAVVNGGELHPATLLKQAPDAPTVAQKIFSPKTSEMMCQLLRLNVLRGTAKKAAAPGFMVGGKTGTAHKLDGSTYASNLRLSSLIGAFPMQQPRYVVLVMLDSPKPSQETLGFATGGWTAAPVTSKIISRIAPVLGVVPVDESEPQLQELINQLMPGEPQHGAA